METATTDRTLSSHRYDLASLGEHAPKAIIQTTTGQKTSIVKISEKLDASTEVVSIEGKQHFPQMENNTLYLPRVF